MPNWTAEQERAINEKGNLLVSAAAGAGKTAVMTERIVRLIAEGADVNELLVVTFTKAAAAEMKQRIEARLSALAESAENEAVRRRLYDAAADTGSAGISTIHSFCQDVLRHNPHLAGLDPAFRVADEAEAAMLRAEALDTVIETAHEEAETLGSDEIDRLIDMLGDDKTLAEIIIKLYTFIVARPNPMEWLDTAVSAYAEAFDEFASISQDLLIDETRRDLQCMRTESESMYHNAVGTLAERYASVIASDANGLQALESRKTYDEMYYALLDFKFASLPRIKGSTAPEEIKNYREKQKSAMEKIKKRFTMNMDQEREIAELLYPRVRTIGNLTKEFMRQYSNLKQEAAIIDFSDMEQLCYEVLKRESVASEYRERYKHIFIDEYQDTNSVQDAIISSISRGDNLFMVGDVKQSIYRFRQAEPANFLSKYKNYDGAHGTRIDLNANFRSRSAVLSAANSLFSCIMLGEVGEIDYSDNAALKSGLPIGGAENKTPKTVRSDKPEALYGGRTETACCDEAEAAYSDRTETACCDKPEALYGGETETACCNTEETVCSSEAERGSAELVLIDLSDSAESGSAESDSDNGWTTEENTENEASGEEKFAVYDRAEAEAMYTAKRIRELMKEERIFDRTIGCERKLAYSDFAVLMRAMAGSALTWVNTLTRCGIPCTADLGDGYFDAIEVQVFINLLRIIDNRRQDIPLMSVLLSPICAFTSEELVEIRTNYEGDELIDRLIGAADDAEKEYASKVRKLLSDIDSWREYVRSNGVEALIGRLLNETNYFNYIGILPGGAVRQANLERLSERAHLYESNSGRGLHGFIRMLDGMRDNISVGAAHRPAVDAVRIMSIHKSKGLEFPVVFIAGIANMFSRRDRQSAIIIDAELGIGLRSRGVGKMRREPLFRRAAAAKDSSKLIAEEMRILYVGMTRAKERLILLGADKSILRLINNNARPLTKQRIINANRYIEWLLGAYFPLGLNIENAKCGVESRIETDILKTKYLNASALKQLGLEKAHISDKEYAAWTEMAEKCDTSGFAEYVNFNYPNKADSLRPAKRSVTDYMNSEYEYIPAVPRFMREGRKLTAAERGTAVHKLVMNLPLIEHDSISIAEAMESLRTSGKLTMEEKQSIYTKGILNLTDSVLWKRIIASRRVERELEFTHLLESGELVQGIIDCCFVEDNSWVIVDYKTTAVREGESSIAVAMRYARQLEGYADALYKLSGMPVKEKWVFLLNAGIAEKV